jgi:uncharacterized membrane protein YhhN
VIGLAITIAGTLGLLLAERQQWQTGKWLAKPIASAGFVVAALEHGAGGSRYGQTILVALALSFVGDVLLIPKSTAIFRAGILAFLAGHLGFCAAFWLRGVDPTVALAALAGAALVAVGVGRWLLGHVTGGMRGPVVAYIAVISTMVALAAGTRHPVVIAGALAFYLSDLSVARDRFVHRSFTNRLWGLPLYYGAQLTLAWTVAS